MRSTALFFLLSLVPAIAEFTLQLPTENDYLFTGRPEKFYMYVDRTFEGKVSKPWKGGAYGYVRTARRIDGDVLLTRFHEGIDIAPVRRDKAGNPLDLITSVSDGKVVHVNATSGRSNYGKYLVVEHQWDGAKIYSLYAHLAEITCKPGDKIRAGGVLGRMGYTGRGINRVRSHLHLEIAMQMSLRFDDWMQSRGMGVNYHGNFNGMNLTGCDVGSLLLEKRKNPDLRFKDFITGTPVYFKVTVPNHTGDVPEFFRRHPWMRVGNTGAYRSWEIAFSATGQPITITGSNRNTKVPIITAVRPSKHPHRYLTRNLISGDERHATLSGNGTALVSLLTDRFPHGTSK